MIIYSGSFNIVTESVGILAGVLILISFVFKNVKIIRIINAVSAITFIIYGAMLGSYAMIITNTALVIIHIFYLVKIFQDEKKNSLENKEETKSIN